ncbi:nuclear encoded CLP protease 5 [Actinidia rufa]|uniref:ATP-dependent Clp protease proteolytic subunit n=1 Tax=Actinidia rufa TaxID=165716 RepID=A0A7J0G169_9ERIC|nr:nuclear encoded CLP protease 5 [Actinidia rufa]
MAQVSSSAASLRLHSLVFSFANPSVFPDSKTLALPFPPLRSRKLRKLASKQHKVRSSSLKATCSGEYWESARGLRRGIWSIRDDLQIPSSPYIPNSSQGQGPPPMVQERFMSVLSQLFHHRIIRCGGPVDDEMANMIVAQLLYLDAVDPTKFSFNQLCLPLPLPFFSVPCDCMAIFDTMKHIRPDVSTVCVGIAASMSAFLLSSGTKGKRFSLPNARIMVHQPIGGLQGSTTEVDIQFAELTHHKVNLSGYLAYQTGQTIEKIEEDSSCDFFMSATEAVEYGIIDGVITNPLKGLLQSVAANADQ